MSVLNHQFDYLQAITDTGPCNTSAVVDFKQGIMRRALDIHVIHVEKLVILPFQVDASMRATVYIGTESTILVHDEE